MTFKRTKLENNYTEVNFGGERKVVQHAEAHKEVNKPNREVFLNLVQRLRIEGEILEEKGLTIELIEQFSKASEVFSYFKMDYNNKSYFVKKIPGLTARGGGAQEVVDMSDARQDLSGMTGVEVADYQFGYQDKKDYYTISSWNNALRQNLSFLLESAEAGLEKSKRRELWERSDEIQKRLQDKYYDVVPKNMAYDPTTDKIIIFDLVKKPSLNVN